MADWYFLVSGEVVGPVSAPGLRALAAGGVITEETPVWAESMDDWIAAGEVEALDPTEPQEAGTACVVEQDGEGAKPPAQLWYLDSDKREQGPLSYEDFLAVAKASWMTEKTLVWSPDLESWTAAEKTDFFHWVDFLPPSKSDRSRARRRLKKSLGGAATVAGNAARKAASSAVGAGRGLVGGTRKTASKAKQVLEENWPKVEATIVDKAVPLLSEGLEDDRSLADALETVYEVLPTPIRLAVPRRLFLGFCLERKNDLLALIRERTDRSRSTRTDRDSASPPVSSPGGTARPQGAEVADFDHFVERHMTTPKETASPDEATEHFEAEFRRLMIEACRIHCDFAEVRLRERGDADRFGRDAPRFLAALSLTTYFHQALGPDFDVNPASHIEAPTETLRKRYEHLGSDRLELLIKCLREGRKLLTLVGSPLALLAPYFERATLQSLRELEARIDVASQVVEALAPGRVSTTLRAVKIRYFLPDDLWSGQEMSKERLVRDLIHLWDSYIPTDQAVQSIYLHRMQSIPDDVVEEVGLDALAAGFRPPLKGETLGRLAAQVALLPEQKYQDFVPALRDARWALVFPSGHHQVQD